MVGKLTSLFSPLLFYVLIKVFSSDSGSLQAGWVLQSLGVPSPSLPGCTGFEGEDVPEQVAPPPPPDPTGPRSP